MHGDISSISSFPSALSARASLSSEGVFTFRILSLSLSFDFSLTLRQARRLRHPQRARLHGRARWRAPFGGGVARDRRGDPQGACAGRGEGVKASSQPVSLILSFYFMYSFSPLYVCFFLNRLLAPVAHAWGKESQFSHYFVGVAHAPI